MPKSYIVTPTAPTFNVCLVGDPGSGKTSLAATAQDHPMMRNVMFLNVEGGLLSVAHRGDIRAVNIRSTGHLEETMIKLIQRDKEYKDVKTVVLDSATEAQTLNLEEIVAAEMDKPNRNKKRTPDKIWQDDYGVSTTQLKRIFRRLKDMRRHMIFTTLAKYVYPKVPEGTDLTNIDPITVMPSLTAKLASSLMGYVDFVWFCYHDTEDDKFKVLTKQNEAYFAKTRGPLFQHAIGDVFEWDVARPETGLPHAYDLFVKSATDNRPPAKETSTRSRKKKVATK